MERQRPSGVGTSPAVLIAAVLSCATASHAGERIELAIHRPSNALFFVDNDDGLPIVDRTFGFGDPGDVALMADFDGDTVSDVALYRHGTWYINYVPGSSSVDRIVYFGDPSGPDIPVAGDFFNAGKAGFGVFRNGLWFLSRRGDGVVDQSFGFGTTGDLPVVADFDGNSLADCAVYRPSTGIWYVSNDCRGTLDATFALGGEPGDLPFVGDFAATPFGGDWRSGIGIFRNGTWYISFEKNGVVDRIVHFGTAGDRPLVGVLDVSDSKFVRAGAPGGPGCGGQTKPCGSLAELMASLGPTPTVRMAAGTFPETVNLSSFPGDITFVGAGLAGTYLTGSGDGFTVTLGSGTKTLRSFRVTSPTGRGIVVQGASVILDHLFSFTNESHNAVGVEFMGTAASLFIEHSFLNASVNGNGLRLEGGVTATVRDSSIRSNGYGGRWDPTSGRGIEMFGDAVLDMDASNVSFNIFGGVILTGTSSATIGTSDIVSNGYSGIAFDENSAGQVFLSRIDGNGGRGTRGDSPGFDGIEVRPTWAGSSLSIHDNVIFGNTTNGISIGRGPVTVTGNLIVSNLRQVAVDTTRTGSTADVTIVGNRMRVPVLGENQVGVFLNGSLTATIGDSLLPNIYDEFRSNPVVVCTGSPTPTTVCPVGGNIFNNSDVPNSGCSCPP